MKAETFPYIFHIFLVHAIDISVRFIRMESSILRILQSVKELFQEIIRGGLDKKEKKSCRKLVNIYSFLIAQKIFANTSVYKQNTTTTTTTATTAYKTIQH